MKCIEMKTVVKFSAIFFLFNEIVNTGGESRWPQGDYTLPKSVYGCPDNDQDSDNWHYGYMNISFMQTIQLFESSLGKVGWKKIDLGFLELLGPYGPHSIQLNFCTHVNGSDNNVTEWPSGRYGIYGTKHGCPSGFTELRINKTVPEVLFVNSDGYLPDINVLTGDNNKSVVSFMMCQRLLEEEDDDLSEGFKNFTFPFILLAENEEKNNISRGGNVTLRSLYFLSPAHDSLTSTRYNWINYYIVGKTDKAVEAEEPEYLERYMANNTIYYAFEVLYSLGCCKHTIVSERLQTADGPILEYRTELDCECKESTEKVSGGVPTRYIWTEKVWILYSLGTSITVSGIGIWGGYHFDFITIPWEAKGIPYVYVNEQKWGFLQNGALECLQEVHFKPKVADSRDSRYESKQWLLINCLNSPVGRYITFVFPPSHYRQYIDKFFISELNIKQFISTKVSSMCNRPLGMREGAISDIGVTASSAHQEHPPHEARPHGKGWCALKADQNPFLQISLDIPHQVEGIQVFNWFKGSLFQTTSALNGRGVGVYSFAVMYGISVSALSSSREFHLDPFLPPEQAQTVWFAAPLVTKVLRIYLLERMDDNAFNCLRLEIIGCEVPERLMAGLYESLSSLSHLSWEDKRQQNPGVLNSPFYPRYYPTGTAYKWTVSVAKGEFINLLFSDISLNVYKEIDGYDYTHTCEDTIYIYPYDALSSFTHMWTLMEYLESGRVEFQKHILTSSWNNQQLSYKVRGNIVDIAFRTCPEEYPILEQGRGFRLLAYSSGTPTFLQWGNNYGTLPVFRGMKVAEITSTHFLGLFFEGTEFSFWSLEFKNSDYILLQITDFDVGCAAGTSFQMNDGGKISRHCNNNRLVNGINSTYYALEIQLQTRLTGSRVLVEGFRGSYRAVSKDKSVSDATIVLDEVTDLWQYPSNRVCSEELNKCYIIVDLKNEEKDPNKSDISWDLFNAKFCGQQDWSMINVHSRSDQEFIREWTKRFINIKHAIANPGGYNGYAYLGLRRLLDKFVWGDGSPTTYEAWATGEPSRSRKSDCTRLNMRSGSAEVTWETISCEEMKAEVGVCEYPMGNRTRNNTCCMQADLSEGRPSQVIDNFVKHQQEFMARLDLSLYFQCGDGEFISLIGKCDGKRDCISGRDEDHCDNSSECIVTQYRCDDGRCIDVSFLCDYTEDCINGEDEECYFPECGATEFTCDSKRCIDLDMRCDGKPDCRYGEDEHKCSSCNPSTSFSCGDGTCVPLTYRCDGRPDCQTEEDEKNCIKPNTCQEWWNAGYRDNGMYTIHDEEMDCNFDKIYTAGQVITKYHSIDFLGDKGSRSDRRLVLTYGSRSVLRVLANSYKCYQSMDQLCQQWIQELYEVDNEMDEEKRQLCQCIRYVKWLTGDERSYYEDCQGLNITGTYTVLWKADHFHAPPYITSVVRHMYIGDRLSKTRIKFNPIICYNDFTPQPPDIVCGKGITTPNETRCLHNLTEFGTMLGCRNLAHLQDCECFRCPVGYFKCPGSFCLENRFVCDGEINCQNGEDEVDCGTPTQICVSQYRCLQSNICLPLQYLCDGYRQCPLGDDERLCNFRCPEDCNCTGNTADCKVAKVSARGTSISDDIRFLDISTNGDFFTFLTQDNKQLFFLSVLNMSLCSITDLSSEFFESMRNLLILDLSYNSIQVIRSHMFMNQQRLISLHLAGNIEIHVIEQRAFEGLHSLTHFELSHVHIGHISKEAFKSLNLIIFDASDNVIDSIENRGFDGLTAESVYLNATEVKSFKDEMFSGIEISHKLITGAYMFCCIRPQKFPEESCYPHKDEFSSCSDLMRNDALRALLWTIGLFSLLGNSASLIYRFLYDRERLKLGYGIFVSNLAFTDFLMGVYLITIASADAAFRGTYTYNEKYWRNSDWCKMAGVLSTISSEGSVLFICLITIDRLLVIKYPFGKIRFTTKNALVASCLVWFVVTLLAILPIFITSYFYDSFYSKTGVCLALPLTRDRPPGWVYSISIFIGLNFVAFLAIAFGQWLIYSTINKARSAMKHVSTSRLRDLRVARNLLLVATTDFLCWFPVGILGILALSGHVIPGDVYAWVAVLVLPINSALNPFLYTLSAILTRGKFTPDTNEQAREQDGQSYVYAFDTNVEKIRLKRALDRLLDLWNSRLLVQSTMLIESLTPLPEYIASGNFNLKKCLRTAVVVAKCLVLLHERELSHSNLSGDKIFVKTTAKGSFNVVLSPHPRLVSTEEDKHEDIEKFGKLLESLLKKCEPVDEEDTEL